MTPKSLSKKKTNKCNQCGEEFETTKNNIYCSPKCRMQHHNELVKANNKRQKKTNKAEWKKKLYKIIVDYEHVDSISDYDKNGVYIGSHKPIAPHEYVEQLLCHQRQEILDQVEKEVEFVSVDLVDEYDDYGKGWHDACLEYDLKLMKLDKKLSAIREEGEK